MSVQLAHHADVTMRTQAATEEKIAPTRQTTRGWTQVSLSE